jgi:hypothetical protein
VQPEHLAPEANRLTPKDRISGKGDAHAGHLKLLEKPLRVAGVSDDRRDVGEHVLWGWVGVEAPGQVGK